MAKQGWVSQARGQQIPNQAPLQALKKESVERWGASKVIHGRRLVDEPNDNPIQDGPVLEVDTSRQTNMLMAMTNASAQTSESALKTEYLTKKSERRRVKSTRFNWNKEYDFMNRGK